LAYWLHTMGELCLSPVSLSFVTKLAPARYVASMMGIYWAAVGFGNKFAGIIGEASRAEPIKIELLAPKTSFDAFQEIGQAINNDKDFKLRASISLENGQVKLQELDTKTDLLPLFKLDENSKAEMMHELEDMHKEGKDRLHATLALSKDVEAKKIAANKGDAQNYSGTLQVEEVQNKRELNTFLFVMFATVGFGILLLLFFKKLKKLTHGAEDVAK